MKLNLKMLAAAALLATAGASNAAITTTSATGGNEIVFAAYDFGAQLGYVLDTNVTFGAFLGTAGATGPTSFSTNLNSLSSWTSFLAQSAANAASTGVQWTVGTGGSGVPNGALVANIAATTPTLTAQRIANVRVGFTVSIGNTANGAGNPDVGVILGAEGPRNTIGEAGDFATATLWDVTQRYAAGTAQSTNLYSYIAGPGARAGTLVGTAGVSSAGVFTLAGPTAPVPEPGTYALMLAGLATLGAVVRRRTRG